jgi:hypothetical protein
MRTLQSADYNICFATMVLTRTDLAYMIEDRVLSFGVDAFGIMNDSSGGSGTSFQIIQNAIGSNMQLFDFGTNPGIMHHKYALIDHNQLNSDPMVLTGSHNWSSAATQRNDENTLIIHDHAIVNQYYQEFLHMYNGNGGSLGQDEDVVHGSSDGFVYPNPASGQVQISFVSGQRATMKVSLMDLAGRVLSSRMEDLAPGANRFHVDLATVSPGCYLVQVGEFKPMRVVVR